MNEMEREVRNGSGSELVKTKCSVESLRYATISRL
jgi:hypothetical protein